MLVTIRKHQQMYWQLWETEDPREDQIVVEDACYSDVGSASWRYDTIEIELIVCRVLATLQ